MSENTTPEVEGTNDAASTSVDKYDEAKLSRSIVQSLSESEKETAARVSYRYYLAATTTLPSPDRPSEAERDDLAIELAKRFLIVNNGRVDRATKGMKSTLKYRQEVLRIDDIRRSFLCRPDEDEDDDNGGGEDEDTKERFATIRRGLERQIDDTSIFIRGRDNDGYPIIRPIIRAHNGWDVDYFIMLFELLIDRALAATELGGGKYSKITVLFDYSEYARKNDAPIAVVKKLLFRLRDHYPEFLEHVFIMDSPLLFRIFYTLVRPFIDCHTKKKIKFDTRTSRGVLSKYMSDDEIMFCKEKDVEDIDLKKYLYDTPYSRDIDGN